MSFKGFSDIKKETISSDEEIEKIEFGYVKETYTDKYDVTHIRIYHDEAVMSQELWEVVEDTSAPLELYSSLEDANETMDTNE